MKKLFGRLALVIGIIIVGIILFNSTFYTVGVNQAALIIRLGKISGIQSNPGMHFHTPFIESVTKVYTGDILYDIPVSDVITSDKKSMIADNYVVWSVVDATKYYQTLGAIRGRAEERIEAAVYNATKNTISSMTQDDIIAARGTMLTDLITKESNSDISQYGIVIEIAEIKALDLPDDNKEAVYERMISERNNIAAGYTAKGESDAQKIKNETDKQVSILTANAEKDAAKLEAEGEAEYMRILSDAYNEEGKAEFYNFLRGLDSLQALAGSNKTIILDKNSEYARILYGEN
ncbi:MAG: protease modulator HflC [Lachnospiraceae bacterium]|nr:protease modulator HflC [Lachnospiraceae bacterium]